MSLYYHDAIIGKLLSDIDSNKYFLIAASFYIFENIYFIAEIEVLIVLQILVSQFNTDKYKWYPWKKQS